MSSRSRITAASLLLLGVVSILACGSASTPRDAPRARLTARSLYPLAAGYAWSYEVDTGDADMHLAISRVIGVSGNVVEVSNGVDDLPIRYELRAGGIFALNSDTWLLRDPIRVGAEWESPRGATARVTSIDRSVTTPAGRFERCVLVVETGGELPRRIETTYCPGVGPAEVDVRGLMTLGRARAHARLRGYTVEPAE